MQAATIPRQYDIEVGPWGAPGTPTAGFPTGRIGMTDLETNLSYLICDLSNTIFVGLMFSTRAFLTQSLETPENSKSLWLINLSRIRIRNVNVLNPPIANPPLMQAQPHILHEAGAIFFMDWNRFYMLQDENNRAIVIRIVPRFPEPPDDIPPIRYHKGDPSVSLHADMGNLLSRLQQCANTGRAQKCADFPSSI
jgi:hypothetical protein